MKLNEKIITLRNQHQMSQGDLAEKLNVSRQSVSKWETGASIPDLDKLIAMSDLFQVTIDELAREDVEIGNGAPLKNENMVNSATCVKVPIGGKKILLILVGIVLILWISIIAILWQMGLVTMLNLVISGYAFLCGMICIFSKKNAGRRIFIMTIGILVAYIVLLVLDSVVFVIY